MVVKACSCGKEKRKFDLDLYPRGLFWKIPVIVFLLSGIYTAFFTDLQFLPGRVRGATYGLMALILIDLSRIFVVRHNLGHKFACAVRYSLLRPFIGIANL
jgi:hypothetical protein